MPKMQVRIKYYRDYKNVDKDTFEKSYFGSYQKTISNIANSFE